MSVDGQQEKPPGQGANASGAMAESGAASVPTAGTEQGIENAGLTRTQEAVNSAEFDQALQAQQHKEKPVFPVHPAVAQPAETVEEENPEVNAQRLNDGTKKVVQGDNPVSSPKDSPQTQLPLSVSTGKDDENSTAADEDGPDNRRVVRSEIQDKNQSADAGEKELPKGSTSSDPVKTVSPEQNRFSDTIQDATRTTTEKTGTVQAAPPERTESSAARRFQTTVMDQIVDKANLRSIHGRSEIQIRLKPDFLGNVQMNIAADKEQVVVRMITDHPVVKEVVEANLHHLKTELQHQGLTIDRFEVTVNPDAGQQHNREQFAQMFKNPSFQNGQGQDPEPEPEAHHRENGRREDSRSDGDDQPKEEGINYFA
jgi:flagellar hook-length control protein FliK